MSTRGFSPKTKLLLTIGTLLLIMGGYFTARTFGEVRLDLSLFTNPSLESGLIAHWTFDSDSVNLYAQPGAFVSRMGGYIAYASSTQDRNATTVASQTGSYETADPFLYDETNDVVYASYGNGTGDQDIYYCKPGTSGDGDGYCEVGEWTKGFDNGGNGGMYTIGKDYINQVIYASEDDPTNGFSLWWCKPGTSGDADGICETGEWTEGWDSATDNASNNRAVITSQVFDQQNGVFYAGTGYNPNSDGEIFYCKPNVAGDADGICEDSPSNEFTKLYDDLTQMIGDGLWDQENSALYWVTIDNDLDRGGSILACLPNTAGDADGICEDGEWQRVFNDLSHWQGMGLTKDVNGGVLYASIDDEILYCKPNVTGDADGYCESGDWTSSATLSATTSENALVYDDYTRTLWVGLNHSGGANSDMYACQPYTNGDADGICETGEFTRMYDYGTEINSVGSMALDTAHHVVYWGTNGSTDDGDLYFGYATSSVYSIVQGNLVPGPVGRAVSFDGIEDYLDVDNLGSGIKTIAFWVKFSTTSASQKIINLDGTDQVETNGSKNITATSFPGTTVIYVDNSTASANIPRAGEWHHVVITDTTGVNGSTFEMGRVGSMYGGFTIDDVRLYNRVLSQEEVTRLYGLGATTRISTTITTNPDLTNSLVGHWTFDGSKVDLSQSTAEIRASVGSVHGNWLNHSSTTAPGTIGQAIAFDGTNDYIYMGDADAGTTIQTISFWVYPATTTLNTRILNIDYSAGDSVRTSAAGDITASGFPGATVYVNGSSASARLATSTWSHVLITDSTGVSVDDLAVASSTYVFGGSIDDLRLYSRILSASDIIRLYGLGATTRVGTTVTLNPDLKNSLVGHWSFDGKNMDISQVTTEVRDQSGNGRNGDWQNHATTTASGVMGQAIYFDGTDDRVVSGGVFSELGTSNQPYTFSVWVKPDAGETTGTILHMSSQADGLGWCLPPLALVSGKARGYSWNSGGVSVTGTVTLAPGSWYYVVNTWDATNGLRIFVNGALDNTTAQASYSASGGSNYLWLGYDTSACAGNNGGNYFKGAIDDFRVFNRSLSADEIKRLYDNGR